MDNKKWFKDAGFGMMIHFGLYSILGGEYKGKYMDYVGEWIQSYFRIPNKEYHALAKVFNPIYFDADEWIKTAKDAGMNYFVVTAKHHDGFALFKSEVSKFNCVDATPFGRDIIGELAESCAKYDMKLGLYYSQTQDWTHPDGCGFSYKPLNVGGMSWGNNWDYTENDRVGYCKCYEEKIKPQVKEILTNYGDLCLIWFDNPIEIEEKYSRELYDMVKTYQPNCLINSRLGNGVCDYTSAGDNEIPDDYKEDMLFETPATLNDTWGFKMADQNWKSPEEIIKIKNHLNERGINYLLNIGPDHLGRFPAKAIEILNKIHSRV